jgi:hypothetical protein
MARARASAVLLALHVVWCAVSVLGAWRGPASQCGPDRVGVTNNMPIITQKPSFVRSVANAALYQVGSGDDMLPIVHLWGTPYQKGFAHGTLMKDDASAFITTLWSYLEMQVERKINSSSGGIFSPEAAVSRASWFGRSIGRDVQQHGGIHGTVFLR